MGEEALSGDVHIRQNPRVVYRSLGDDEGGVLLHLDTAAYHGVNAVGALVWNLVGDGSTIGELLGKLESTLEDAPPSLAQEISAFVVELAERDLVVL